MKFNNPVIPGFYPDPSVCRVQEDYYLVTSSFDYFPGVPLFHSKDLINWRQISHCLTQKSQLYLEKTRSSDGIFAPTIRYHQGIFYVVTTNWPDQGHFYVHTRNPYAEWSEPIWVDQEGIDPSLFFDDDGKVYFTSTGKSGLAQSEINIHNGKLLSLPRYIYKGTGGSFPEAPHLYKIKGVYYLMIAEGGTEYGHMETIARGNSPWGPFEPCPHNPVLTHRSLENSIQAAGHADLIQDHRGNWWVVFLGIRPNGYPPCHHLGRETFLAPVIWRVDGWPLIGCKSEVALEMEADCLPLHPWEKEKVRDDFDSRDLKLYWNFLKNPNKGEWSLEERQGWLKLRGSALTLNDFGSPAFVGRRQQHFFCKVSALLDFYPRLSGEEAGLTVRMNERHHYEICVTLKENLRRVIVRRRIGSLEDVVEEEKIGEGLVRLEIKADRNLYYFAYSLGDEEAKIIGKGESRYLSTEVAGGFSGVYLGMYATGNGRKSSAPAFFDWFEYFPLD